MRRRIFATLACAAAVSTAATTAAVSGGAPVGAATVWRTATVGYATQDTALHVLAVRGHALDRRHPARSIGVRLYVNGRYRGHRLADVKSPRWDRRHHVHGAHRYLFHVNYSGTANSVAIVLDHSRRVAAHHLVRHVHSAAAGRIIAVARRYVGRVPYRYGGASPRTGFDCSGYVRYAYLQAHVRRLPHNAQAQRHVRGMHIVSRRAARPGDLVFYLAHGSAYHVAIYAGRGKQYAAVDDRHDLRYERIRHHNVEYRSLLHQG